MAVARYLADTSVWARMSQPTVRGAIESRIERGLVGTCPIVDLEILYSARTGAEHDHFSARRRAFEYFPLTDDIARRAIDRKSVV